jgi:hypothetical protein
MITTNTTTQTAKAITINQIDLAQLAIDIIKKDPRAAHCQNPTFSRIKEARSNHHYVLDTYHEIVDVFGSPEYTSYNTIMGDKEISSEVKKFFRDAHNYFNNTHL